MTGFSVDWLNAREQQDLRARDTDLLQRVLAFLHHGSHVVDLGAGTGATLRAFANQNEDLARSLVWRLLDNDPELLQEANRRHGQDNHLEIFQQDISQVSRLPIEGARLVTASALFDLVSADFVARLAASLSQQRSVSLYVALTYDGTMQWSPSHPLDEQVVATINRDQKKDKGFGPALGPDAASYTREVFLEHHFQVETRPSPWRLDGTDQSLLKDFVTGISNTVERESSLNGQQRKDWLEFRIAHAADGFCTIGHVDLLAIPSTVAT